MANANKQKKKPPKGGTQKPAFDLEGPRLDTIARALATIVHRALPDNAGLSRDEVIGLLERPPDPAMGDFAFPCFRLARSLRKAPPMIACELAATLADDDDATTELLARAEPSGPYVNLTLNLGLAAALLLPARTRGEFNAPPARATRIMVEFSQPNTHKAFHVGHMRNLCLGDALVRDGDAKPGAELTQFVFVEFLLVVGHVPTLAPFAQAVAFDRLGDDNRRLAIAGDCL
jgi:hypothetical protein